MDKDKLGEGKKQREEDKTHHSYFECRVESIVSRAWTALVKEMTVHGSHT